MERWIGKIAVVTGASSGIGAAVVQELVAAGITTIGLARRLDRLTELKSFLPSLSADLFVPLKCDLCKESEICSSFKWIVDNYGGVDILVNNAGLHRTFMILDEGNTNDVYDVVNTNLNATVFCIREAFNSMKNREQPGHMILINSSLGHNVINFTKLISGSMNIYPSTKFGVTALTEVVRQELQMKKSKIKITSISPGLVKTEMTEDFTKVMTEVPTLESKDIADAVLYALSTPEHVQVHELTIKPIGEM